MNILLLSNSAPNYHHFFKALVRLYAQDGAVITVAVDSRFSREENGLDDLNFAEINAFESWFVTHKTDHALLARYGDINLNHMLLSDFERAQVYGIWGDSTDLDWFDRLKSALLSFYEDIFRRRNITTVLYENVSNAFAYFALIVAQRHGARYMGIGGSRLPGRFALTEDPLADLATSRAFAEIREGRLKPLPEDRAWAQDYLSRIETITPDYMKINGLDRLGILKRYLRRDRIGRIAALLRHARDSRTSAFQIGNPLRTHIGLFRRNVARRLRAPRVRRMYQQPVEGERFLLYPLHFHPESSTSILASSWLDEYEVIRNIAFNLPEGMRLYVKDHASAWAYPTLDFYRRLRALPNVRLLPPEAPTKQLIKQSDAVITLTSTVGYEALLLRRRVFLFGRVFYEFHKGVVRLESPQHLHLCLQEHLAQSVDWDDDYNLDFVCAYHAATLPGSLNLMLGPEGAQKMAAEVHAVLVSQRMMAEGAQGCSLPSTTR
jgi:hypothetical protein